MKDASTYQKYAADCLRIAKMMPEKDRATLLKIAKAWEECAREAKSRENNTEGSGE